MDYGQLSLDGGQMLHLYGTPGQERFGYMRQVLSRGGLGLILLLDNAAADPFGDLEQYLSSFTDFVAETSAVIGVVRSDLDPDPTPDAYYDFLAERGIEHPVLFVDVRKREDVVLLIEVLLAGLEFA
jgi:signal recognition particle receptor subunit beta